MFGLHRTLKMSKVCHIDIFLISSAVALASALIVGYWFYGNLISGGVFLIAYI